MATSHLKSAFAGALIICVISGGAAYAASPSVGVNGEAMGLMWIAPFAGMLLSIALLPLLVPHFWHRRYGLVSLFWAACFLVPFAASFGLGQAGHDLAHTLLLEYIPFVILIGALFTISGGIYVGGNLHGAPVLNVTLLLIGMLLASFAGTTGASMMLIRPLLRANDDRKHNVHVVVFFIFLVSNIGGALTPLGDPPLFLGYLQGVPFLWPLQHLWGKTLLVAIILLAAFFVIDIILYKREGRVDPDPLGDSALYVRGLINVPLFIALVAAVAVSGSVSWGDVTLFGTTVSRASLARDAVLLLLAGASLLLTPKETRQQNEFNWGPAIEVAKLFAAIFVTIIPAITILKAGQSGAFAPLLSMLGTEAPNNVAYFWLTGILSSVLDNAPTYLVFFNAAGGDVRALTGPLADTLAAISAGAVFMGANTYIGNAPNFMVKSMAEGQGVRMPSFFGYMLWSGVFLLPTFALVTMVFFR